jgi:hypothetical protein
MLSSQQDKDKDVVVVVDDDNDEGSDGATSRKNGAKRQRIACAATSGSAAAAAAAAVISNDEQDLLVCCMCKEQFVPDAEAGKPDRTPRALVCGHDSCTSCLGRWVKRGEVECPECRRVHKIELPDSVAAAGLSTGADWVQHIRLNRGLIGALRLMQQGASIAAAPSCTGLSCSYPACTAGAAAKHCAECHADYCSEHDSAIHELLPLHTRISMQSKAVHTQQALHTHGIGPAAVMVRQQLQREATHAEQACDAALRQAQLIHAEEVSNAAAIVTIEDSLQKTKAIQANTRQRLAAAQKHHADAIITKTVRAQVCEQATALGDLDLLNERKRGRFAVAAAAVISALPCFPADDSAIPRWEVTLPNFKDAAADKVLTLATFKALGFVWNIHVYPTRMIRGKRSTGAYLRLVSRIGGARVEKENEPTIFFHIIVLHKDVMSEARKINKQDSMALAPSYDPRNRSFSTPNGYKFEHNEDHGWTSIVSRDELDDFLQPDGSFTLRVLLDAKKF